MSHETESGTNSAEDQTDPVVRHSRREGVVIGTVWLIAAIYCTVVSVSLGYATPDRPLGLADVRPILGFPRWVVWGFLVPWLACGLFTMGFAGWYMADDELGGDDDDA